MKTKIISAFPACGKTYCSENKQNLFNGILDSDSSNFSWVKENGKRKRNPNFPKNYIEHIKENIEEVEIIFISSHNIVRKALEDNNIEYYLIYPDINLKNEWVERFIRRGNSDKFIEFIKNKWEYFITEMDMETFPTKIRLPYKGRSYIDTDILIGIMDYKEN